MTSFSLFIRSSSLTLGVIALALSSCTSHSSKPARKHRDSARVEKVLNPQKPHQISMQGDLQNTLFAAIRPVARANAKSAKSQEFADAVAMDVARDAAMRMSGKEKSSCELGYLTSGMTDWMKCVIKESLAVIDDRLQKSSDAEMKVIAQNLQRSESLDSIVAQMGDQLNAILDVVSILRNATALNDLPWISKRFFEGRKFALTNSLQQESVGTSRVLNLDSLLVRFELNAGRLFVIREKQGAYDGSSAEDMIVTSYPVRTTRQAGGETFYQVDFSDPDNKRILMPHLAGYGAGPEVDIAAESIKIRIAHAEKAQKPELATREASGSGLYFDGNDQSLVLDELILVNSTAPDVGEGEETSPVELGKEILRPTIRFAQGFFAINSSNNSFTKEQQLDIRDASSALFSELVEDNTNGEDVPYFLSQSFLAPNVGIDPELRKSVRKYNTKNDLVFVLSRNTPAVAIPVLKSAINSYAELFKKMTPAGQQPLRISAVTQKEFEEANRIGGLALGGEVNAADPRVNMVQWDDNPSLGAAWATAAAHPFSGEIISADVLMSGSTWGMVGCTDFLVRTWASKPKPGEKPNPFPHAATMFLNSEVCKLTLFNLKLIGSAEHTGAELAPGTRDIDVEKVTRLTAEGNQQGLNDELAKLLRQQLPTENTSDLKRRAGENEEQYSERLETAAQKVAEAYRAQVPDTSPATVAELQRTIDGSNGKNHKHDEDTSPNLTFVNGKNVVRAKPDCVLQAVAGRNAFIANAGVPGITSEFVKDPKQAALATIRIVLVHELGHTFGLRHNFIASTTPSELEAAAKIPVPVTNRTDSIMDYNDSGVELDMGAMSDYANPEAALNSPSFGVYDVVALANIYGLDASQIKLKNKTKFCTDGNKSMIANCVPFDYGSDSMEHALYQMNLMVQELRVARDTDLQFGPVAQVLLNRYQGRINNIGGIAKNFWSLWGQFEQLAALSTNPDEQAAILQLVDKVFYAKGLEQEFFSEANFKNKAGMDPVGLWALLNLSRETMTLDPVKPQAISGIFATELRRIANLGYLSASKDINDFGGTQNPDSRYLKGVVNIVPLQDQASKNYLFRDMLGAFFSRKVMLPEGEIAHRWVAIINGSKVPGKSTTDPSGNPITLPLAEPLFNHKNQVKIVRDIKFGDSKGGEIAGIASILGENDIKDMVMAVLAKAQLAPWGGASGGSDIFEQMKRERAQLADLIASGNIASRARDAALFMISVYDEVLAKQFKPM